VTKYLKKYEAYIKQQLLLGDEKYDWEGLKAFHKTRIEFMQHERLIHLMVTLTFALLLFLALSLAYSHTELVVLVIIALLLALLVPYVFHYFTLENGVQRWYRLYDEIEEKQLKIKS
jgi:cell division protein FtsW (lipid II flippase)